MAELKVSNEEKLNQFMKDNNLDTLNYKAIALMFMKQQDDLDIAHQRIEQLQEVQKEYEKLHNNLVDKIYNPEIDLLKKIIAIEENQTKQQEQMDILQKQFDSIYFP
jgi:hypothetical protein